MIDFNLIQHAETGKVYYYAGDILPDGCTWNPRPDVERVSGWWSAPRDTQMQQDESCVGENTGKIECLVFSRVVGFITPTKFWNHGKKQEWKERATYKVDYEALA